MISFESTTRESSILSPLRNFERVAQTIEHRKDPLTQRSVIVLKERMDYVKRFIETDSGFLGEFVRSTQADCPFCPGSVQTKAPKFIREISREGRIEVGEAVCFPSLFAHEDFNAIVVPTRSHGLELNEFSSAMFVDAFKASIQYFERVQAHVPEAKFATIIMNFLPPAGSTVAHSHLQALASDLPFHSISELLEKSKAYSQAKGSSYWADLVEAEKRLGERYLGKIRNVHWLAPFAPLGLNEVQAVVEGKSSFNRLSVDDLCGLAEGVVRVLKYYHDSGIRSFNVMVYSGPLGQILDYFTVGLRMVSRYGYKPRFVSDMWALQYLLGEQEVYGSPEETCTKLRPSFR